MGTPSIHALPEHWTELNAARRQRRLCAEQVEAIKGSCKDEFGTDDVAEHPQYYGKLLDRIRARYNDSEEREWFAQRRAFLHELDGLFQDAKEGKRTLSSIEARIESEKEAWYRWVLRRYPEFIAVSDRGANQEEIRGMLDDPDRSREELVRTMMEAIGQPADSHVHVVSFAEKVDAVKDDADELKKLYIAEFFTNHESGTPLRNSERYLEEYRNSNTMTLEDVIDRIMQDFQRSRNSQPQREEHKRRLDELRRAKTAFEQNRMQAKGLKEAQALGAGPELYEVQPCLVCGTRVSLSDVFSCAVCQAMVQLGGEARLALYCSEQCFSKGHDDHVDTTHDCEAADDCVQLGDEDTEMEDGTSKAVICDDCVDSKQATLYCSQRCATANLAKHRRSKHGVETAVDEVPALVRPLHVFVDLVLKKHNPGIAMTPVYS